jgi:hypothetical protein
MIDFLYRIVKKMSGFKWVVIFGVLFMVAGYLNVGRPFGITQLEEITNGVGTLDEMFYNAESAYRVMDQQGEAGREFYRRLLLTTELVFPLVYRAFNVVFLSFIFGRWLLPESKFNQLCLLPLVGMVADYCENVLVLTMLFNYPERLYGVVAAASIVTAIKWLSNLTDWLLIIVGLFGLARKSLLRQQPQSV